MASQFSTFSAYQLKELIGQKKISLIEVIDYFLQRIKELNPTLNALLYINDKNARNYAVKFSKFVEENNTSRALLGVPIVVPDSLFMKLTPSTFGSLALKDNIRPEDQIEVTLQKQAGAIILGKANMAEFRLFSLTRNLLRDPCLNPTFPEYSPGGPSAGGGAAVAAGMAPLALTVDMGGGLRVNSSACDLIGLIPSRGLVPTVRGHLLPYSEKMFYRKGIIARDIRDVAMMLNVLAHPDRRDSLCTCPHHDDYLQVLQQVPKNLKIAWCPKLDFSPLDPEVSVVTTKAVKAFEAMGHHVEEYSIEFTGDTIQHFLHILEVDRFILIMNILRERNVDLSVLADYTNEFLKHGDKTTGVQYALAIAYTGWIEQVVTSLFKDYDLLVLPTSPRLPPLVKTFDGKEVCMMHKKEFMEQFGYTCAFNMSGHPAISLPCGHSKEGLPVGLQLVAPQFAEGSLLSIAKGFLESQH